MPFDFLIADDTFSIHGTGYNLISTPGAPRCHWQHPIADRARCSGSIRAKQRLIATQIPDAGGVDHRCNLRGYKPQAPDCG